MKWERRAITRRELKFEGDFTLPKGSVIYVQNETEKGALAHFYPDPHKLGGHSFAIAASDYSVLVSNEMSQWIIQDEADWTRDPETGRSNSSPEFERLSKEVGRILRSSAADLIGGRTDEVGRLIMAQLAHVHRFAPES